MKNIILFILTMVLLYAFSDSPAKEAIVAANVAQPIGPYSQALRAGGKVYVSGQIALKPDGSIDTTDIKQETKQVLENIKGILEAASLNMRHVNKVSIYTTQLKYFSQINEVYQSYFSKPYPARETIEVKALPKGAHIEISVMAD